MFLSSLLIDVGLNPDRPRPGRLWLRNLYHVHQRLCMAFPSDHRAAKDPLFIEPYSPADFPEQRHLADKCVKEIGREVLRKVHAQRDERNGFLFRVDPQPGGRVVILVQSAAKPDWRYAFDNVGFLVAADCEPFDPCFAQGERLRFRLVANPTRKIDTKSGPDGRRRHGRRVPVRTDQLYEWLARWAGRAGFVLDRDSTTVQPGYVYVNGTRDGQGYRLRSARYDGMLTVSDAIRFRESLVHGIGPAKGFGFGLLSVKRAEPWTT